MTIHDGELTELLDREKIRSCLARLARGEDRRNAELITGSFWPQAIIDQGVFTGTLDEYLTLVVPGPPEVTATQHMLGQSVFDLYADTALVETHVLAYHRIAVGDRHRDTIVGGRYLDWMDKIGNQWRIAQRATVYDWVQDSDTAFDWAGGIMGMPLDAHRSTGRAVNDCSEGFFGDYSRRDAATLGDCGEP